jgi:hypothetical protein
VYLSIQARSSGPLHREGGRRCWGDLYRRDPNTDRRWLPLAGGVAGKKRREVLMALGPDLVLRGTDGALTLERAGGSLPIAPAECKPLVLARSHEHRSLLLACATGDPAELRLWRDGSARALAIKVANPPAEGNYSSELERMMHDLRDARGDARRASIPTPDGRQVVDLADGRILGDRLPRELDDYSGLAVHGRRMLLQSRFSGLAVVDEATGAWTRLKGKPPELSVDLHRGRLYAFTPRSSGDERAGILVDIEAAAVLGTFTAPVLTISETGWLLSPVPPAGRGEAKTGPLRWVRPTPP